MKMSTQKNIIFKALGFVLLPDGTIYYFGKAIDLITKEEVYDPYIWQHCNHEVSLRKLIRKDDVEILTSISYAPTYYELLKQLVAECCIVFLNRNKKSNVQNATIFINQKITNVQYDELVEYAGLCNQCDHMTVSYLQDGMWFEKNNVQDLMASLNEFIMIENVKKKKK